MRHGRRAAASHGTADAHGHLKPQGPAAIPHDRGLRFEAGETSVMYGLWVVFPQHLPWLVWLWVAALALTTVQRTVLAWRLLR